jgi:hypothetical protein
MMGVDQSLVWVVVALVLWGMVMVYSASIAMPDNPRFSRYTHTHFLIRHVMAITVGCVMALLAFQVPMETWEKMARPLFVLSLILLALVAANVPFFNQRVLLLGPQRLSKPLVWRLAELVLLYFVVGGVGLALENHAGQIAPQGWEFYAVTGTMFVTLAFPGFVYRYLMHRKH